MSKKSKQNQHHHRHFFSLYQRKTEDMSKDIVVLTPNGRRLTIHCTPDTSILQVLEDVCKKQGFAAESYGLKHHNHLLDLTTTIRFSNLPNKACLEMVEAEQTRVESNVTVGLVLEDGERRTAEFSPSTNLFDLISSLAPVELNSLQNPSVQYMRQEVVGTEAMKAKTLRQLGLIHGRAIIRLLNKAEEKMQANVSAVYNVKPKDEAKSDKKQVMSNEQQKKPKHEESKTVKENDHHVTFSSNDNLEAPSHSGHGHNLNINKVNEGDQNKGPPSDPEPKPMEIDGAASSTSKSMLSESNLERRLKIEDEVKFLGSHKAIAFTPDSSQTEELEDLPDDFYELSVEEVRRLYGELQARRAALEDRPLLAAAAAANTQSSQRLTNTYKNAVVRIQFPDHMILQGVFSPTDTIQDVTDFIKQHLKTPEKPFVTFTTPMRDRLDSNYSLAEAGFVPCVHMHFRWLEGDAAPPEPYLRDEIYHQTTPNDAASILASKYRAPSRQKTENAASFQPTAGPSKVPKWFKK